MASGHLPDTGPEGMVPREALRKASDKKGGKRILGSRIKDHRLGSHGCRTSLYEACMPASRRTLAANSFLSLNGQHSKLKPHNWHNSSMGSKTKPCGP